MAINPSSRYMATIETDKGMIRAELFASSAPETVNNFVFLAKEGFYNGLGFHYVQKDWVAQAGDPACQPNSNACKGIDGPGYAIPLEPNSQRHVAGALAMVRVGDNSHGSQFYITYGEQSRLDNSNIVFGRVVEGLDVLRNLTEANPRVSAPTDRIIRITVQEQPAS
jgi:cyclophilin family peptidyl-prolyl cis-trans isomerase